MTDKIIGHFQHDPATADIYQEGVYDRAGDDFLYVFIFGHMFGDLGQIKLKDIEMKVKYLG